MTAFLSALLLGAGVSLLVWKYVPRVATTNDVEVAPEKNLRRSLSAKRKAVLIEAAGQVYGTDADLTRLARLQLTATITLGVLAALLISSSPSLTTFAAAIPMVMLGWKGPLMMARAKENRRRTETDLELVDALGEMVMGVEAGLTLDVVMLRYAAHRTTPLAFEFRRFLDQLQLGSHRSEALKQFAERTPTQTMRNFSAALLQNQKLGTPLAQVLRQQASTARRQRRQAIEAKAAKIPLKMIFPTVFCILPVLMIVVVGPSIIRLIEVLP